MPQIPVPVIPKLTIGTAIDIAAVAFLIYQFIMIVRGRRSAHILNGLWILLVVYVVALWTGLDLLRSVLAAMAPYTAIALIVMFQSDIRRFLSRIGRFRWLGLGRQLERRELADEIILALEQLVDMKAGALIVVERDVGLRTFIESGVAMDAAVSRDLLCAVFHQGGALHDGAVIVQGDRVAAAACFLPLTTNPLLQRRLGTRHRAAIGITEETDALAVVLSEETRQVSIASRGDLEPDVTLERVRERLTRHTSAQRKTDVVAERHWGQVER